MNHSNIKEMRKQVGLVFQYPEYQLFESTVYKDIAFGIRSEGLSHEEEYRRVLDAAEKTGLSEDLLENSIYDLSGGQKRRATIAGIIVMNPEILVLDEPAAGLDPAGRDDILQFAKRLRDDNGITVILVSHSMEDIAKLADKVIVLNEGKLEMMGTPREVFRNEQRLNQIGLTVPADDKSFPPAWRASAGKRDPKRNFYRGRGSGRNSASSGNTAGYGRNRSMRIAIGQYVPGTSALHRADPRTKFVLTFAYMVVVMIADNYAAYLAAALYLGAAYVCARINVGKILRSLRPLIIMMVLTALLNLFFYRGTTVWIEIWKIQNL